MHAEELEAFNPLHCIPINVIGGALSLLSPVAHVHREVIFLAPLRQGTHLLPVGCLVVVGHQAYHCFVVSKLTDWVGDLHGHALLGEQGVQEGLSITSVGPP